MRNQWIIMMIVWGLCTGLSAAALIYLGSGTEHYQSRWPLAGLTGAAVGTAAGLVALNLYGNRKGILLMGVLLGLMLGVATSLFWSKY